jgi:PEP-CTERM motif
MKIRLIAGAVAALMLSAVPAALGVVPIGSTWYLDENGPAFLSGPGVVGFSDGTNKVDSISGITGWYYQLGLSVAGDVVLVEPQDGSISDLLRFDGAGVFFFSDLEENDPNPDKADVPIIPDPINPVILTEVGPEGSNGVSYFPSSTDPGYDLTGQLAPLAYQIVSDIPEPGTIALVGLGLVGLLALRRRR